MRKRERLVERCRLLMADGAWWSISAMAVALKCSECGASARIRDQRKAKFGGHKIVKRAAAGGIFLYRMDPRKRRLGRSLGDLLKHSSGGKAISNLIGKKEIAHG